MKKLFAVLVVIALVASFASAQDIWGKEKMSAGVGAELSLPMSDWGDAVGIGFGGFGLFQYGLDNNMMLVGQLGYTMWSEKDNGGVKVKGNALIILAGMKYNISGQEQPGLYVIGQIGIYSASITATVPAVTIPGVGTFGGGESTGSDSKFGFLPGIGYQLGNIDVNVKYCILSDINNLALNVAYVFPL